MLNEYKELIPTKKEMKLQIYINQLINDLYSNEKIEVDSIKLLELLSYLTSNENISTQMKTATEYQNRKISDILHIKEVEHLKNYIKYLKENSIPKQKIRDVILKIINYKIPRATNNGYYHDYFVNQEYKEDFVKLFNKLLEDK